jgi:hypothetical protein
MATRVNAKKKLSTTKNTPTAKKPSVSKSPRNSATARTPALSSRSLSAAQRQQLMALDDKRFNRPTDISVADIVAEAKELEGYYDEVGDEIVKYSKVERTDVATLPKLWARLDAAQLHWQTTRRRTASPTLLAARTEAEAIEGPLFGELRHFLEGDADVQVRLDEIQVGDGDADTVQDLRDLADLHDAHRPSLRKARLPKKVASLARATADTLEAELTDKSGADAIATAMSLRNRAYWSLRLHMDLLREGGRHVFRDDPGRQRWFRASSTRSSERSARRSRKAPKGVPAPTDA